MLSYSSKTWKNATRWLSGGHIGSYFKNSRLALYGIVLYTSLKDSASRKHVVDVIPLPKSASKTFEKIRPIDEGNSMKQ